MKPREELIAEGILNENKSISHKYIAAFYVEQLEKFNKVGMGKMTENDVLITPQLIKITRDRLKQIKPLIKTNIQGE